MTFQPCENAEAIPGYVLQERIGVGGYGEVWKVSAPGGLNKAMKFVYGRMDDERGARELKALGRIKEVRHPFLLSIERFDVVDGQLMVLTELADMSLMDRCRECRDSGLPGIPRDELLGHLRDAADALDYMSEKYGLQHLDIKPENLLLVGGRIKVADFGLVKDLHDTHVTNIAGVTPLYATPEAFEGKASRQSDQYSLAIVYQEMLTGVLPFPGFTTAQLAMQHLNSLPLLGPLPESDRRAIGRALAKKPEQRFTSCRHLIDVLLGEHRAESAEAVRGVKQDESSSAQGAFDLRSTPGERLDETERAVEELADEEPAGPDVPLEAIDATAAEIGTRPTLFIGVGGLGAQVLRRLRHRLHDRFTALSRVPTLQCLLLDTDPATLRSAEQGDPQVALAPHETVYLPLRRPADYRAESNKILGWLSRRWLYNIPRTLRTEGLRPLGRLAYIDHADKVVERMRRALAEITQPEAIEAAEHFLGAKLRSAVPRVFLIASISGGTGGGMLADLGYLARQLLAEMGFAAEGVCGIMLHATMHKSAANDLRKANAFATLTELNHYSRAGTSYRAKIGSELESIENTAPPFAHAYLIHLGDDLRESDFDAAVDRLTTYLYLDAATPCGAVIERCRGSGPRQAADGTPQLRTIGMHTLACNKIAVAGKLAEVLCHRLVTRWHDSNRGDDVEEFRVQAPAIEFDDLSQRLFAAADRLLGGHAEIHLRNLAAQMGADSPTLRRGATGPYARQLSRIDALLGAPGETAEDGLRSRLQTGLQEAAKQLAKGLADTVNQSLAELVEDPRGRVPAALRGASLVQGTLKALKHTADEGLKKTQAEADALRTRLLRGDVVRSGDGNQGWLGWFRRSGPAPSLETSLLEYGLLYLRVVVYQNLSELLQSVHSAIGAFNDQIVKLRPKLEELAGTFSATGPAASGDAGNQTQLVSVNSVRGRVTAAEFVADFDRQLQQEVLQPLGGLIALASGDAEQWKLLRLQLQMRALSAVLEAMCDIDAARILLEGHPETPSLAKELSACVEQALPYLSPMGAARRLLVVLPRSEGGRSLERALKAHVEQAATSIFDDDSDVVLCQETEQVSLPRAARFVIGNRADYLAASRRVLSRVDVSWAPLPITRTPAPHPDAASAAVPAQRGASLTRAQLTDAESGLVHTRPLAELAAGPAAPPSDAALVGS